MSRIDDVLALIDDPARPCDAPPLDAADPLLDMLVVLAHSDGILHDDELALLTRLRPDLGEHGTRDWLGGFDHHTFDARAVAASVDDPFGVLRLATRMVCMDGDIASEERAVLEDLAEACGLDEEAPQRAVAEVVAEGGPLPEDRVFASLRNMLWSTLEPTRDEPEGELAAVVPAEAEHIATMLSGDEAMCALYVEGLAARFEAGVRFIHFADITTYTRVPVPGASFHVHTMNAHLKVADPRMKDLGQLLDFLYGRKQLPTA